MEFDEKNTFDVRQWEVFFHSISDMAWIADRDLKIVAANKAFASFLHTTVEQLPGRECYEVFHGAHQPFSGCPYEELIRTKSPVTHEIFDPVWGKYFRISASPVFDANGTIVASVHIVRDVTHQKKTEEELKEAETLYRTISVYSHSGLVIVQGGKTVYANPYILSDYGYSEADLLGKNMNDFIFPEDRQETRRNAIRMLKGESGAPYSYRVICADGSIRSVVETVASIEYKGSRAVLGNIMDVTEQKKIEKQLTDAREMLIQSEKLSAIGTLAGGISHEILNPLNIISLTLQMLGLKEWPPDKMKEMLATCDEQVKRIEKIAHDVNTFAKMTKNDVAFVSLNELIESVLNLLSPKLRRAQITLLKQFQPGMPDIPLDQNNIWQVIMSLIGNAMDAMAGKEEKILEITTDIDATGDKSYQRIVFNDRGTGIRKEEINRIFDPFFTTKEPGKGTGLGLSIARRIVEEHGGLIRAENNTWGGASFIVELPMESK